MAEGEAKHDPTQTGLRGTDNCPACGRAMEVHERTFLGRRVRVFRCTRPDHDTQVTLDLEANRAD